MKTLFYFFVIAFSLNLSAQDWPVTNTEAKPGTRWWWLGSAVDKDNLTYNIQEYAKTGMGTLEITPIYGVQNNEANELSYLSSEWMDMLKHTQAVAGENGINIDMNNGTGWPFGGTDVTLEDAATKAIFQEYKNIKGNNTVILDIAIHDKKQKGIAKLSRVMAYNNEGISLDITKEVKLDSLYWDAPCGSWHIVALHIGKTLQRVKRAAPGGEGYVVNHFDKKAVITYLNKFNHAFNENSTSFPVAFFNDSYEVYQADWTPNFLEEFEKRRGYKLENYFPEFLDIERPTETKRIVSDYRETISELLIENFTEEWTKWANNNGAMTRSQAHGSPANLIDTYAAVDIPECEGFGLSQFPIKGLRKDTQMRKNDSDISMLKYASSAAHITGKPLVSSETFTWLTEHFRTSLSQCKPDMDLMFLSGVNRMFFHGTPYSPKEAEWPGWLFYASINMSPSNTIWKDAPAFFQYITRCQSFLQMGKPDNDFLVYLPIYDLWYENPGRLLLFDIHKMKERAPAFIETIHQIMENGYDVDYISDKYILTTHFEKGKLVTEGGSTYKAIIVPSVKQMPVEVLAHLNSLVKKGATLLFINNYPEDVPGYYQLDERRKEFNKQRKELPLVPQFNITKISKHKKGTVVTGKNYREILRSSGVVPERMRSKYGLQYVRRRNEKGYHYFISNLQASEIDEYLPLSVPSQSIMVFNPLSGEKGLAQTRTNGGQVEVRLQLKSGESIIVQTFNDALTTEPWRYYQAFEGNDVNLNTKWNFRFLSSSPSIEDTFQLERPISWTKLDHPDVRRNMATGLYSTNIQIPEINADDWLLNLGDVRESATVRINGNEVATLWSVPFEVRVGRYLKQGNNNIEIEVTNLPANRVADLDRKQTPWRRFKEINMVDLNYTKSTYESWETMLSGLNGDVKLIPLYAN